MEKACFFNPKMAKTLVFLSFFKWKQQTLSVFVTGTWWTLPVYYMVCFSDFKLIVWGHNYTVLFYSRCSLNHLLFDYSRQLFAPTRKQTVTDSNKLSGEFGNWRARYFHQQLVETKHWAKTEWIKVWSSSSSQKHYSKCFFNAPLIENAVCGWRSKYSSWLV